MELSNPLEGLRTQKHKSCAIQEKKRHTQKLLIFSDPKKKIIALTEIYVGSSHDFGIYKYENVSQFVPKDKKVLVDTGFEGIEKYSSDLNIKKPKKKPKGRKLNGGEKLKNKTISKKRVKVEHAIGGVKRFRITSDTWRSITRDFNLTYKIVCGIWNFIVKSRSCDWG